MGDLERTVRYLVKVLGRALIIGIVLYVLVNGMYIFFL